MEKTNKEKGFVIKVYTTDKKTTNKKVDAGFSMKMKEIMQEKRINKIAVLSFVGKAGRGKSTLASLFVNYLEQLNGLDESCFEYMFEPSNMLLSKTKDLYCYGKILKIPDSELGILVMDCQGDGTLPENVEEEDKERLNLEKNLFIAMSTSSVVIFFLEARYNFHDSTTLNSFQNLFEKIKNTTEISYPGMILMRNKTNNLKVDDKKAIVSRGKPDKNKGLVASSKQTHDVTDLERQEYLESFIKSSNLEKEMIKNLFAIFFPTFSVDTPIREIIKSDMAKYSFDYIIDVVKRYPKYLNEEKDLFMDANSLHDQIENIIDQVNKIENRNNFKNITSPLSNIIRNKIKFEYSIMKEYFVKIFREILKDISNHCVEKVQSFIDHESKSTENLRKFENIDKKAFLYYKKKLDNFISSNLNTICSEIIQGNYIRSLNELEEEIEKERNEITSKYLNDDITQTTIENEKKRLENEFSEMKTEIELKNEKVTNIETEIKKKEDTKKETDEKYISEQMRTQHVKLLQERIGKIKNEIKILEDNYNLKDKKVSDMQFETTIKNNEKAILMDKLKRLKEVPEEEINYLDKIVKQLEMIKTENTLKHGDVEINYELLSDQVNKVEKEISVYEKKFDNIVKDYQQLFKEKKDLQRENNYKEFSIKKNSDKQNFDVEKNKVEISCLNQDIKFLKNNENYLEDQKKYTKDEISLYKSEYSEREFLQNIYIINRYEKEIEEKKKKYIFISQYDQVEQEFNKLKAELQSLNKKKEFQQKKLDEYNAEDVLKIMGEVEKEKFEREKWRIKHDLTQTRRPVYENIIKELNELVIQNQNLLGKIKDLKSDKIYANLDSLRINISSTQYQLSELSQKLKIETESNKIKHKTLKDNKIFLKKNYSKKIEGVMFLLKFVSSTIKFLCDIKIVISNIKKDDPIKNLKQKFFRLIAETFYFIFSQNEVKLTEYGKKIQYNPFFKKVMSKYHYEMFEVYLFNSQIFIANFKALDDSNGQIIIDNYPKYNPYPFKNKKRVFSSSNNCSISDSEEKGLGNVKEIYNPEYKQFKFNYNTETRPGTFNDNIGDREVDIPSENGEEGYDMLENDDEENDSLPFADDLFFDLSQETLASFSNKILFSSDGNQESKSDKQFLQVLKILENSDRKIMSEFKAMNDSEGHPFTLDSDETPLRLIFEVLKSRTKYHIQHLLKHPKLNRLLTTFYLHTDERFRTNFNNLCGKILELPFIIERKDRSRFINNEIINTNSNFVYFGFIPWNEIESEQEFYKNKSNFINELFNTNFVESDITLKAQFRFYDVTDTDNKLFSFFLLNYNYVVKNDLIDTFLTQFDVLFFFIERNNFEEFIEFYMRKLKSRMDKLLIVVLNNNYSNHDANSEETIEDYKKQMKNESNFIILNIDDPCISEGNQNKIYNFIDKNIKVFKETYVFRKECMVSFLTNINNYFSKKTSSKNLNLNKPQFNMEKKEENLTDMFISMKQYISSFLESRDIDIATIKKRINSDSHLIPSLFHNDFFNLTFLKQCFYTKNILNCEVERNNPQINLEDREEYNKLIFTLNDSRMKDKIVHTEIINFLKEMSNKSKGNFITKFYLFTTILKNTFTSNPILKQISDQFSFEHLLREIYYSKILNSGSQNSNNLKQNDKESLENIDNNILSDLVQNYQPFEIVDGDSLKFSLDNSNITLGDKFNKNIFIVSIVGPQSTGKSTINNQIFSVEFQTSQGRCSRGIYGALIPIKENPSFQYILVLDTEGIDSKENKNDKILTRRLLLFILKVSHVVLLSPGAEMKANFFDELIMSCNNYVNSHVNFLPKPLISCLFNKVGAHRDGEIQNVFLVWEKVLKEKLYADDENNFREFDIRNVFDFAEPEAIPNAFDGKSLNLIKKCNSNIFGTAFNNKINSIRQVILSRLNNLNIQPITFDGWLKSARYLWQEISQIKSLSAINRVGDIRIKHKLNDILTECKNEIKANSREIETSITEFKNKMSEDDKCSIEKLIEKFRDFSYKQCEEGREKIIKSFEKKVKLRIPEENNRIPEQLLSERIRQIEKMFKLIELDYQLLSFREIQKELRLILLVGKSDFHRNLRVEAYNMKDKFTEKKENRKPIDDYFENYFTDKSMHLLNNLEIINIDNYHRNVFYYITLKADLNFDADSFEFLFRSFNSGNETTKALKQCYFDNNIQMLTAIDKFQLNPENYSNAARSYSNPYIKILNVIKSTSNLILQKKVILENINYNHLKEQFYTVIMNNKGGFLKTVGKFFNLTSSAEDHIVSILTVLQHDVESLGYKLDDEIKRVIKSVFQGYSGFQNGEKLLDLIVAHLKQMDKYMRPIKSIDPKIIPKMVFIHDDIYGFLHSNKSGSYEIENSLNNEHNERYIRGLKLYFESCLYNYNFDPYEINKFTNTLLCSDYVLNIKGLFDDINSKILNIFGIDNSLAKNIKEYEDFFYSINPDPLLPKNVEKLIKNENLIAKTSVLDSATLTLLFQEIEKIFNTIRDGYRIYGFEINDHFKFYLYTFLISNATLVSFINYRLKSLTLLIEFHKNKSEMKEEFYCIISNNYDQLNSIAVNNIFKRFVSESEGCATDFVMEKYKNEMNLKGGNISSINQKKKEIEDKILADKALTTEENEFYLKMVTNPDEVYDSEFQKIWDILDGTVKQECGNVYAKKITNFIGFFEQMIEELKKDFSLDVFKKELHEVFTFLNTNEVKGNVKDLQAKALFLIFKYYMLNINQMPEKIQVENNIEVKFNMMRLPMINLSLFNGFPQEFKDILKRTFLNDERIFNMNLFITTLEDTFLKYKSQKDMKNKNLDMSGLRNKMKIKYLECVVPCPFCKRKCEEIHDSNDKMIHKCSSHQYRIFAGIKLSCHLPSFMFCDKILNDSMINFNGSKKSWGEIKRDILNNYRWEFSAVNDQHKIANNETLLSKVWSLFGRNVCDYYNNLMNLNVTYTSYEDFKNYKPKTHYIFMLDYSGSMAGTRWRSVKDSFNNVMQNLVTNNNDILANISVSVGIFGSSGQKQIIAKEIKPQMDLLVNLNSPNMGTDYGEAFTGILDMMNYNPDNHEELVILFMTDGEAYYPSSVLTRFTNNDKLLKKSSFHILFYNNSSSQLPGVLKQIDEYLKPISKFTAVSTAYNPNELDRKFFEIINLDLNLD